MENKNHVSIKSLKLNIKHIKYILNDKELTKFSNIFILIMKFWNFEIEIWNFILIILVSLKVKEKLLEANIVVFRDLGRLVSTI